jgi:hypothetical protein
MATIAPASRLEAFGQLRIPIETRFSSKFFAAMQRVVSPRPDNGAATTRSQWLSLISAARPQAAPTRRIDKSMRQISAIINAFRHPQYFSF